MDVPKSERVTYLSVEDFERLLAWLDEPPEVIPAMMRLRNSPIVASG